MTFLLETIRLGIANLRLHKLRSFLTALGIILGVAAVICMVSIGEGSKQEALRQIEQLGARNIIVRSQRPSEGAQQNQQRSRVVRYGITWNDLRIIEENFSDVAQIVALKEIGSEVLRGPLKRTSQAYGVDPRLGEVANLRVARGRYLTESDNAERAMVCVIGAEVARLFFPLDDPVGATINIDDKALRIVGVLEPVGLSAGAGTALVGRNLNMDVHVPLDTARYVFGDTVFRRSSGSFNASEVHVSELYMTVPKREQVVPVANQLERLLSIRQGGMQDVTMIVPFELLENAERAALRGTLMLMAIAGISLLVGGIGIMNIMLATVTERTREIGIRRALGATRRHIVWQFLVETSVLSLIGGIIGVGLGVGLSLLLGWAVPRLPAVPIIGRFIPADASLPTQLAWWSVAVAMTVAVLTGLVFGLYPARKAARQDPIVALRHD
ncbi:MAG: ABC transporter substrate-binding protein [Phycisphaerales bacterium]|nr:MAG: ABC transporter substrate-binding protein [Phycisphaerales bacterium]